MNAPLTMQVALAFGIIGLAVALMADALPRRPQTPPDWDPYRWRLWQNRVWPQEPVTRDISRAGVAYGLIAYDLVKTVSVRAAGAVQSRAARLARSVRSQRTQRKRVAQWRKTHARSTLRNAA